jgi:hypothetical protein
MGDAAKVEADLALQTTTLANDENSVTIANLATSESHIASTQTELAFHPIMATDGNPEPETVVTEIAEQQHLATTSEAGSMSKLRQILRDLARSELLEQPESIVRDMASHRFWATQPVPAYGEERVEIEEGPIKIIDKSQVALEPSPLLAGFEWVTMGLVKDGEVKEVYELLNEHYVEDDDAAFWLHYPASFLKW